MADTHAKHHDYHLVNPSPVAGRRLRSFAFIMAVGLIIWMRSMGGGAGLFGLRGPGVFPVGVAGVLFTMFMWWRDVIKEAHGGDHTPVVQLHLRYGMILFIASEVMFFVAWFWAYFDVALFPAAHPSARHHHAGRRHRAEQRNHRHGRAQRADRRPLAAQAERALPRHVRSLGPAAGQHADPADLGHHGHLGAPCAAGEQPQGPGLGPRADRDPRRAVHRLPSLRVRARRLQLRRPHLWRDVLHGDRLPRRARDHRHAVPDRVPVPGAERATSRPSSTSASRRLPGTGTSSTWCGCSCSSASTCGAPARRWRTDDRGRGMSSSPRACRRRGAAL